MPSKPPVGSVSATASLPEASLFDHQPPCWGRTPNWVCVSAQTLVGAHYSWAGASTATGFDCSGLVYYAFRSLGYTIGRTVEEQYTAGRRVRLEEIRPGDILFYQNTYVQGLSHDGIYVGGGKSVHAVDEATGVATTFLNSSYWEQRYAGAIRLVE